ncbi:MAG: hypothetical protein J1F12_00980 [Muribaculaceae bacterium]|nr:hypothetical protein [Muribaculaceae bacterium]
MINKKLLTSLTVGTMMLATACSGDNVWDYDGSSEGSDYVDVTLTVTPETHSLLTRADDDAQGPGQWQNVSRGKEIDMLIYGVYEYNETPADGHKAGYQLLTQYRTELPDNWNEYTRPALEAFFERHKPAENENPEEGENGNGSSAKYDLNQAWYDCGLGMKDVSETIQKGRSQEISLRLMRGKTYYIAFWAQSSLADVYDFANLEEITVDYTKILNNDEHLDAFCKMESFTVTEGQNISVTLYRPFAQINIGTTGAEIASLAKTSGIKPYVKSEIEIEGVCNRFNVLEDKVIEKEPGKVTFQKNTIPAYYDYVEPKTMDDFVRTDYPNEEYLKIDLNQDGSILDYQTYYPTLWWYDRKDSKGNTVAVAGDVRTETFKYLSMTYVLVPSIENKTPNYDSGSSVEPKPDSDDLYKTTVNIKASFIGTDGTSRELVVSKVPVQRNWRTNILGGLTQNNPNGKDEEPWDPNDPEKPNPGPGNNPPKTGDDPSKILGQTPGQTQIVSDYYGEHNPSTK